MIEKKERGRGSGLKDYGDLEIGVTNRWFFTTFRLVGQYWTS